MARPVGRDENPLSFSSHPSFLTSPRLSQDVGPDSTCATASRPGQVLEVTPRLKHRIPSLVKENGSMKWNIICGALLLSAVMSTQSFGFELLNRMLGIHSGCCASRSCCSAPSCCQPACGCEPCQPKCGCEPNYCCQPKCGCEPRYCCQPKCGCEPSCGCKPACGCDPCRTSCCKPRRCFRISIPKLAFPKFNLFGGCCHTRSCCDSHCCQPKCGCEPSCCCQPKCGCEPSCCCQPKCGCEPNCCCQPACGCDATCCRPHCGCEGHQGNHRVDDYDAPAPVIDGDDAPPPPPAPIVDPSAFLRSRHRVIQASSVQIR